MDTQEKIHHYFQKDINRTVLVSFAFHILIFAAFLCISIGFDFTPPDFAEISFVAGEPLLTGSPPPGASRQQQRETVQQTPVSVPEEPTAEKELVSLPKRRMLENEDAEILARDIEKQTAATNRAIVPTKRDALISETRDPLTTVGERSPGEKITPGATRMDLAGKEVAMPGVGTAGETDLPFKIEGEASQRSILHKVIPQYPQGLQSEAVVKVQFSVLADGTVGRMVPVIKGNATLENITLDALRQWRFNPLPANAPQREVEGIITFRYILR